MTEQKKNGFSTKSKCFLVSDNALHTTSFLFLRKQTLAEWRALEIQRLDAEKLVPENC